MCLFDDDDDCENSSTARCPRVVTIQQVAFISQKKHQLLCFQSFFLLLHRYRECVVYLFKINFPLGGSTVQPTSTIPPNASCSTRCSGAEQPIESNTSSSSWTCGCSDNCLLKNSCCSDYAAFCLTGKSHTHTPIYYIILLSLRIGPVDLVARLFFCRWFCPRCPLLFAWFSALRRRMLWWWCGSATLV